VLGAAVSVAVISTYSAYRAMVNFGRDVLGMTETDAWTGAGVFELSLVTVALLAREAAKDNRPSGTLLTLTWILSSLSGMFAGWHELYIGHPLGAGIFRLLVPLLAALMWHLALVGDRHLATGSSWSEARTSARMYALFTRTERWFRTQAADDGSRAARRAITRADRARQHARYRVLQHVPTQEIRGHVEIYLGAVDALGQGTSEVGASVRDEVTGAARALQALEPAAEQTTPLEQTSPLLDQTVQQPTPHAAARRSTRTRAAGPDHRSRDQTTAGKPAGAPTADHGQADQGRGRRRRPDHPRARRVLPADRGQGRAQEQGPRAPGQLRLVASRPPDAPGSQDRHPRPGPVRPSVGGPVRGTGRADRLIAVRNSCPNSCPDRTGKSSGRSDAQTRPSPGPDAQTGVARQTGGFASPELLPDLLPRPIGQDFRTRPDGPPGPDRTELIAFMPARGRPPVVARTGLQRGPSCPDRGLLTAGADLERPSGHGEGHFPRAARR